MKYAIAPNGAIVLPPARADYVLLIVTLVVIVAYIIAAVTLTEVFWTFYVGLVSLVASLRYSIRFIHRAILWRETTRGAP